MKQTGGLLRSRRGTTLVEMIVCFALLGIFMVSVAVCVSSVVREYYYTQRVNDAQTVADTILQTVRARLQPMQGIKSEDSNAYIKLRSDTGATLSLNPVGDTTGSTIEFICPVRAQGSDAEDNLGVNTFASQIDTRGISADGTVTHGVRYHWNSNDPSYKLSKLSGLEQYPAGYLVQRYYANSSSSAATIYRDRYTDGGAEVYEMEMPYTKGSYMDFTISELTFTIPADAKSDELWVQPGGHIKLVTCIKYVDVSLTLSRDGEESYTVKTAVQLWNLPQYKEEATMTSDLP